MIGNTILLRVGLLMVIMSLFGHGLYTMNYKWEVTKLTPNEGFVFTSKKEVDINKLYQELEVMNE
jgi:hypothetical protein